MGIHAAAPLAGKTVLVTGATSGIGLEAAVVLAKMGAQTVITGRDPQRIEAALERIRKDAPQARADALQADFASQAQVRKLAEDFRSRHARLDVLINNAGGVHRRRTLTEDGFEATFAVNHLAPFLLTRLLLDRITASAPARIVNVASAMHRHGALDLDDPSMAHGYSILNAYARSKLANVLFTRALAERLAGQGVTVNAVHPGTVATRIWSGAPLWVRPWLALYSKLFMLSAASGAQRLVYLATSSTVQAQSGRYFENNRGVEPAPLARDDALAAALWQASERWTGVNTA
ncbi:MAG: SDR family oxidoreductase [Gammaproteobacteria bacterium]